jgi:hypothetical protein
VAIGGLDLASARRALIAKPDYATQLTRLTISLGIRVLVTGLTFHGRNMVGAKVPPHGIALSGIGRAQSGQALFWTVARVDAMN